MAKGDNARAKSRPLPAGVKERKTSSTKVVLANGLLEEVNGTVAEAAQRSWNRFYRMA